MKRSVGRPKQYEGEKKDKRLTITEEGWEGAKSVIKSAGYTSVSQFLEELGRGRATIAPIVAEDKLVK